METHIPVIILAMVLATQVSRLAPLFILSKRDISPRFEVWLQHVPIAILTALIVSEFFIKSAEPAIRLNLNYGISGFICLLVGLNTKNFVATTVTGVVCVALLRVFGI